jgi:hypothetical protein
MHHYFLWEENRSALTAKSLFNKMVNMTHSGQVISLYRRILKLHRCLPTDLRYLGDQYTKDEVQKGIAFRSVFVIMANM